VRIRTANLSTCTHIGTLYTHTNTHAHTHARTYISTHTGTNTHTHARTHTYTHMNNVALVIMLSIYNI